MDGDCRYSDTLLDRYITELEDMLVPGLIDVFCRLVGPQGNHSEEFMKVRRLYAAQATLKWAKEQLAITV